MADDPAFVWDSGRPARPLPPPQQASEPAPEGYVTLKEAEEATGVPATTIRNWARKERVPSNVEVQEAGPRRMVDLRAVTERARMLGRLPDAAPAAPSKAVPDDHVLVPIDAWDKMLMQLGNLHEAGQDLAAARERAAKAETEAAFLRERIAELRAEREEMKEASQRPVAPEPQPVVPYPGPAPAATWWDRARALALRARRPRH